MHTLIVNHGLPPRYNAGSEVYSQSICVELTKKNKISALSREENPYLPDFGIRSEVVSENLNLYFINNPQGKDGYRHFGMDLAFEQLVRNIKPDVAHIGHLNHLSTGFIDVLKKLNIPIVFTLHDFWLMCPRGQFLTRSIGKENNFELCSGQENNKCASDCYRVYFSGREENEQQELNQWSDWVRNRMTETKSIIEKVDLFIAPSKYLMNRFTADFNLPQNKIVYLDYGFPLQYLMPTLKTEPRNIYTFGYIGTHIPAKGIHQLIQAFSKLSQPAKLIIYGRENGQVTQSLKVMANECTNPIEFAGEYINQNLADQVFSKVDCIVAPSIWAENSPLVIHEAQACKIPVITADFGGMKEYVNHHVNGLLFEHRSVDSLTEQLEWAVSNPEKMKQYGGNGYLHNETGRVPDIEEHCKQLDFIYTKVKNQSKLWRITIDTNPEDCNLHCVMCEEHSPYSDFIPKLFQETGFKRRRMDITTVEQIFLQASALGVKEIIPSTMGEPLLYKGIERIFELAKAHKIKINLTTNGTFPRKTIHEWARIIVPNTTDIKISWNGATKGTSEAVMKGLNFEKVLENTKSLIELRNEHFTRTGYFCRITLQLTFMQSNMHELGDIIKLAASLGIDRVKGHHLWAHFQEIHGESMKHSKASIADWNRYVADALRASETNLKPNGEKVILENILPIDENEIEQVPIEYECPFLDKELWISATGKISPCCAPDKLRASLGDFGNIKTHTISEVLSSNIYQNLVSGYKDNELCKTCNMRKPK